MDASEHFSSGVKPLDGLTIDINHLHLVVHFEPTQSYQRSRLADEAVERTFFKLAVHEFAMELRILSCIDITVIGIDCLT